MISTMKILAFFPCLVAKRNQNGTVDLRGVCMEVMRPPRLPARVDLPVFFALGREETDAVGPCPVKIAVTRDGREFKTITATMNFTMDSETYQSCTTVSFHLDSPGTIRIYLSVEAFGISASWPLRIERRSPDTKSPSSSR